MISLAGMAHRINSAAVVGFFAAAMALGADARADAFFEGLDGDYQGKGFVKMDPKAPEENIRCRLNLGLSRLRDRLYVRGNCSIAGFLLPVNGSIIANNSNYSANLFNNLVQVTANSFSGRRRGSDLRLIYDGNDVVTREAIKAAMTIRKRRDGFDIQLSRTGSNTDRFYDVGTIKFDAR
jgi:hypothetical protein